MQDVLGLGSAARMNLPGRPGGNWQFRFTWEQLHDASVERLARLARLYDR
jgi:4-alpha-glucanotransferase